MALWIALLVGCNGGELPIGGGDTDVTVDTTVDTDTTPVTTPDTDDTDVPVDTDITQVVREPGDDCDPTLADDCGRGLACCTECCEDGKTPVCTEPDVDGECPLPDLTIIQSRMAGSVDILDEPFASDSCALAEGCVGGDGFRRLLKFTVQTPNRGTADLRFGVPDNSDLFEYSECHQHYHFTAYANYKLVDSAGNIAAEGHKQAFCLEDYEKDPDDPSTERAFYDCSFQGIQVGWSDTYDSYLDCQWIDITDVAAGSYFLEVDLNPEHVIPEKNYDDNNVKVAVKVLDREDEPDPTESCSNDSFGEWRNCGFTDAETFDCNPGDTIDVGCQGGCQGDPVLRVCTGTELCHGIDALASVDDSSWYNQCPSTTVTCPPEGQVTLMLGPYSTTDSASCNLDAQ